MNNKYTLRITKIVPNENIEEERKDFDKNYRFRDNGDMRGELMFPQRQIISDVLTVELTDEQYKKVKLEVLKSFE